jgi:hypothetical protein
MRKGPLTNREVKAVTSAVLDEVLMGSKSKVVGSGMAKKRKRVGLGSMKLVDAIRPGCRVTIVNRFGQQRTGTAVMRGPHGWVLNMGGKHGTPGIATDDNTNRVVCKKR